MVIYMSGINGFTWHDSDLCQKMNSAISHRGPDGTNIFLRDNLTMGYVYLKTPDNFRNSMLPIHDESEEIWLIYDGEIYNYEEVRKELENAGHTFTSDKEAELLLKAYIEWGLDCFQKFNGVWSVAIYDGRTNKLVLVRDRFGTKPLYYRVYENDLIFSSEILGILAHPLPRTPNKRAVIKFLHDGKYIHSENWLKSGETFFSDIYLVFPGEYIAVELGSRKIERHFWYIGHENIYPFDKHEGDPIDHMKLLFLKSIRERVSQNTEIASSLSGGIDSSSIVCAIRHEYPDSDIRTFSMIYPGKPNDESKYANLVVDTAKAKAEYISPNPDEFANDIFDLIRTQQEPFQGLAVYGQYKIMEHAHHQGIKILMDGMGADLLLTPTSNGISLGKTMNCLLKEGFKEFFRKITLFYQSEYVRKQNDTIGKKVLFGKDDLLTPEEDRAKINVPNSLFDVRADRNGMHWGIITRMPFQCKYIQEFGASLPNEWRIQNGISKYIFRQSMIGILPEGVLNRKDKQGYVLPDYELMSSPSMRDIVKEITHSDSFLSREYWDGILVQKLFDDLYNGKVQWNAIFWRIINVEIWHRIYFDGHKKTTVHSDINSLDQPPAQMQGKMS